MSAEPAQPRFDQARAEAFAGQLLTLKPDGVYLMQDISGTSHVHQDIEHPEQLVRGDEVSRARSSTSTRS